MATICFDCWVWSKLSKQQHWKLGQTHPSEQSLNWDFIVHQEDWRVCGSCSTINCSCPSNAFLIFFVFLFLKAWGPCLKDHDLTPTKLPFTSGSDLVCNSRIAVPFSCDNGVTMYLRGCHVVALPSHPPRSLWGVLEVEVFGGAALSLSLTAFSGFIKSKVDRCPVARPFWVPPSIKTLLHRTPTHALSLAPSCETGNTRFVKGPKL